MPITTYIPKCISENYREQGIDTQDISFVIKDKSSGETKKLGAHKFVLALNSDVLKAELYGTLKESNEITIVDGSFKGFQIFLDALYGKQPCWLDLDIDELLELNYLATKYLIEKLCEVVFEAINEHKVTKENVKMIFEHAQYNPHLDNISEMLYRKCYDFYATLSAPDITDLMCQYEHNVEDIQLLVKMMAGFKLYSTKPRLQSLKPSSSCCIYCLCPDGKHIGQMSMTELAAYLRPGMRVVRGHDWREDCHGNVDSNGAGTVISTVVSNNDNNEPQWIIVKWDNGNMKKHRMGYNGEYELKLAS